MRHAAVPILSALLALATAPAEARPQSGRPPPTGSSDMDVTLARMAGRDRLLGWRAWRVRRPLARALPPATRERVAAPPLTGWGYGGTIPGTIPGF